MSIIDKIFKHKLEHHTMDVSDDLWNKIEANLPNNKQKKWLPIIGISTFLLIAAIATGIGLYLYPSSIVQQSNAVIPADIAQSTIEESKVIPENTYLTSSDATLSQTKSELPSARQVKNVVNNHAYTVYQRYNNEELFNASGIKKVSDENNTVGLESIRESAPSEVTSDISSSLVNSHVINHSLDKLSEKEFGVQSMEYSGVSIFKKVDVKPCPFGESDKFRRLDFYVSPEYALRSLYAESDRQDYMQMRKTTESSKLSYSMGLRFGYSVGYRWNIMTGLNFSKINESFEYIDPESVSTRVITTKDYIIVNGVKVDSTTKEEIVEIPGTEKMYINNSYKTLDIPLMGRYILQSNEKYSISAIGGALINLSFTTKGKIISPYTSKPDDITTGSEFAQKSFKTNIGATLIGGVSFAYFLSPSVDVLVEPTVKFQPTFLTYGSFPVLQRYATFGVAMGFRYRF